MRKPNLNNFGDKLKFKPRTKKRETISEKDLFIETMTIFTNVWARSNEAYDKYKINLLEYEELYYQVIEGFILLKYDFWKAEIILWYIFARLDENNEVCLLKYRLKDEIERETTLNTPSDLWDFLQIIENDLK